MVYHRACLISLRVTLQIYNKKGNENMFKQRVSNSIHTGLCALPLMILSTTLFFALSPSIQAASKTTHLTPNIIGFFQTYDNVSPEVWYFANGGENISDSGYTILIDAFWVNYPYCWGDGSGQPGKGSPIPECLGVKDAPGPGTANGVDAAFWTNYQGQAAPDQPGTDYNTYWTSLHTSGPQTVTHLRNTINNSHGQPIKLLASIGGWNMGGSSAGTPSMPDPTSSHPTPAWAALLKTPETFAQDMSDIMELKANGVPLYDGIDIDIETLYGEGCAIPTECTPADEQKATDDMVQAITLFKQKKPNAILSISPRAADIACEQQYCGWNDANGIGFVGNILQKLAQDHHIYFDDINPQFYNDDPARNIPNEIDGDQVKYGNQVVGMLKKMHDMRIIGPNTTFNIGVLAQTNSGEVDAGGSAQPGNPGVPKALVQTLWNELQTDPAIINTGIKINGLMNWAANLALHNTGVGGNIRTTASPSADVVPFNWGAGLTVKQTKRYKVRSYALTAPKYCEFMQAIFGMSVFKKSLIPNMACM